MTRSTAREPKKGSSQKESQEGCDSEENAIAAGWYILKQASEKCKIISADTLLAQAREMDAELDDAPSETTASGQISDSEQKTSQEYSVEAIALENVIQKWGPFETQNQAIAKRVGLIRAGKCQPN